MGGGGLLGLILTGLLVAVPFWRLLPKFGLPNWLALFAIVPIFALVLLWIMAFRDRVQ
ncbi:MAG: hypothetical protein AAF771_16800 [Pseudomonadota bacterium]